MLLVVAAACRHESADGWEYSAAHRRLVRWPHRLEARLSGSWPADRGDRLSPEEQRRVARQIESELARERSAEHLAAAGVVRFLLGRHDQGIALLEEASAASPRDLRIANDLGAILITPPTGDDPVNVLRALDLFLDRTGGAAPPAWLEYNQGLAFERLGFWDDGQTAFRSSLALEPDPAWKSVLQRRVDSVRSRAAGESWTQARERLIRAAGRREGSTVRRLATKWSLAVRDELEEEQLGAWGEHLLAGRTREAGETLEIATEIARALATLGDPFSVESLPRHDGLAAAHLHYRNARRAQTRGDYEEAESEARAAAVAFRRGASPFAELADRVVATSHYQRGELDRALGETVAALRRPEVKRYPSVAGRWLWLQGICLVGRGRPAEALDAYTQAERVFQTLGDSEAVALSETYSAETLNYLGLTREAARRLARAMPLLAPLEGRVRRQLVSSEVATLCLRTGLLRAALAAQTVAVRQARASGLGYSEAYALMRRARIHLRAQARAAAADDLARARRLSSATKPGALRERMEADLAAAEGAIALATDPASAARSLERALSYYDAAGRTFQPLVARYQLARAYLAAGRVDEAMSTFESGLSSRETLRSALASESQRESFFDEAQAFFDDLVGVAFRAGDMTAAFEAAERSRSRVLLDRVASDVPLSAVAAVPPSLATIRARLPPGAALLELHADAESVRAIFVGSSGVVGRVLGSRRQIGAAAASLERGWQRGDDALPALATLYESLVRPFARELDGVSALVLVPHRELSGLPFAAFYDRANRQFLVEQRTLTVAPSAAVALPDVDAPGPEAARFEVVVFADPAIDPKDARFLSTPLPAARTEAAAIAASYRHAATRLGSEARIDTFLAEAGRYEIVHVATHGRGNPAQPGSSFLAFARPRPDQSGLLRAAEIATASFHDTRLVVLAACDGARGSSAGSEGSLSVARSFLAAGVPAVVASLSAIEDRTAAALFTRVHRYLAAGEAPAEALRHAQLELARGADARLRPPWQWGSIQLVGRVVDSRRRS